jgi:hypothetical protein
MEGLYVKIEKGNETVGRVKFVRRDFVQTIIDGGAHWSERPMIANGLAPEVDLDADSISWATPGLFGRDRDGRPLRPESVEAVLEVPKVERKNRGKEYER